MKIVDKITPRSYEVETALAKERKGENTVLLLIRLDNTVKTPFIRHPRNIHAILHQSYNQLFFQPCFGDNFDDHK